MKQKFLSALLIAAFVFVFAPHNVFAGIDVKQDGTSVDKTDHLNFTNGCYKVTRNGIQADITPGSTCVVEGTTNDANEFTVAYDDPTSDNAVQVVDLSPSNSAMNYVLLGTAGIGQIACNTARKGVIGTFLTSGATNCTATGSTVNTCFCSGSTWTDLA